MAVTYTNHIYFYMTQDGTTKQRYNDRARESLILSMKGSTTYALAIIAAFWWVATQPSKNSVAFNGWAGYAMWCAVVSVGSSLTFWFVDTRRNYCKSIDHEDWWTKKFERFYYWLIGLTFGFLFVAVVCSGLYVDSISRSDKIWSNSSETTSISED